MKKYVYCSGKAWKTWGIFFSCFVATMIVFTMCVHVQNIFETVTTWFWWYFEERIRVPTGQGKLEKPGNLCRHGKVRGKYYFWKVRANDVGSCRMQISVIFFCIFTYWKAGIFVPSVECPKGSGVSASLCPPPWSLSRASVALLY